MALFVSWEFGLWIEIYATTKHPQPMIETPVCGSPCVNAISNPPNPTKVSPRTITKS